MLWVLNLGFRSRFRFRVWRLQVYVVYECVSDVRVVRECISTLWVVCKCVSGAWVVRECVIGVGVVCECGSRANLKSSPNSIPDCVYVPYP